MVVAHSHSELHPEVLVRERGVSLGFHTFDAHRLVGAPTACQVFVEMNCVQAAVLVHFRDRAGFLLGGGDRGDDYPIPDLESIAPVELTATVV